MSLPDEFNPRFVPELALQTYEYFGGDTTRTEARADFVNGDIAHMRMRYPLLSHAEVDGVRHVLDRKLHEAAHRYGDDSATVSSVAYRLLEADFLSSAVDLNAAAADKDDDRTTRLSERYQSMNEQLYGRTDGAHVAELWDDIRAAYEDYDDPRIVALWSELDSGFAIDLANGYRADVPGLTLPYAAHGSEELSSEAAAMLRGEWQLFAGPITEAVGLVTDMVAAEQGMQHPYDESTIIFSGRRLYSVFALGATGLAELYEIEPYGVEQNPSSSAASWQTGDHRISVGLNRSAHAGRHQIIRGLSVHESTHGLKATLGALSNEPALATGVFTRRANGQWVSYLDYEEGNNMIGERLLGLTNQPEPAKQAVYPLMLHMAEQLGYDDRQIFETYKRIMAIEMLAQQPDAELEEVLHRAGEFVAEKLERILRGAPTDLLARSGDRLVLYSKDLAYSRGRRVASAFWNATTQAASRTDNPQAYIHNVFDKQNRGKIDPSEAAQAQLVGL